MVGVGVFVVGGCGGFNCGGGLSYGFGFALCGLVVVLFAFACGIRAC